jgi:hypothetical protein
MQLQRLHILHILMVQKHLNFQVVKQNGMHQTVKKIYSSQTVSTACMYTGTHYYSFVSCQVGSPLQGLQPATIAASLQVISTAQVRIAGAHTTTTTDAAVKLQVLVK